MKVRIASGTRDELSHGEHGAWEDDGCPGEDELAKAAEMFADGGTPDEIIETLDMHGISSFLKVMLGRYKTRLEVRNAFEALVVFRSVGYWRTASGMYWWTPAFGRACDRIWQEVADAYEVDLAWHDGPSVAEQKLVERVTGRTV